MTKGDNMKKNNILISAFVVVMTVASCVNAKDVKVDFDGLATKTEETCNIREALKGIYAVPAATPVIVARGPALTAAERQNILLAVAPQAWTTSSGHNYARLWMPRSFKLVGGTTLLVEVRQEPMMQDNIMIPVKVTGDKYEYGFWNYKHCSPSMTLPSCFYKIKVQFEVVSDSVLQGTVITQNSVDTGEAQFVFYKN